MTYEISYPLPFFFLAAFGVSASSCTHISRLKIQGSKYKATDLAIKVELNGEKVRVGIRQERTEDAV